MNKSFFNYILNGVIIIFLIFVGYLAFLLINNSIKTEKEIDVISDTSKNLTNQPNLTIQFDDHNETE